MRSVSFSIDGLPVGKGRPRAVFTGPRAGMLYTPKATRSYEARVAEAGRAAMNGAPLFTTGVRLIVEAYLPVPQSWPKGKKQLALAGAIRPHSGKHYDFDNYAKAASDALNGVVYLDDRQVVDGRAAVFYSECPRLDITVTQIA
jgi:Holliday junction resolvase RusA-like endonuclease